MSRRESIQDKRRARRGLLLILSSISLFLLLMFAGVKYAANVALFAEKFKKDDQLSQEDKTPPGPPRLDTKLPKATNKERVFLEGYAESNSTVKIYVNEEIAGETQAGEDSKFSVETNLKEGQNEIWAKATDKSGNEGDQSPTRRVIFDNEAPEVNITEPKEGDTILEKILTIKGKTEVGASLTANDRVGIVDSDGNFTVKYSLSEGENVIKLVSVDLAENKTEKEMKLIYEP